MQRRRSAAARSLVLLSTGLLLLGLSGALAAGCDDDGNPPAWKVGDSGAEGDDGGLPADGGAGTDLAEPDASPGTLCRAGQTRCWEGGKQATCLAGGVGWLVEACPAGELCLAQHGRCLPLACQPGELRCAPTDEGAPAAAAAVQSCAIDGTSWSAPIPCQEDEGCRSGVCLPRTCTPGEPLCGRDRLLTCRDDGMSWIEERCPPGWGCYQGRCLGCVRDADCLAGQVCASDLCQAQALTIVSAALPAGMVDEPYAATLQAAGGTPPYRWSLVAGTLPAALTLDADRGELAGTPAAAGETLLTLQVGDGAGATVSVELRLVVHGAGLVVTTETLPQAEEGVEYAASLEALGGVAPYAWMVVAGTLPAGLALQASGGLLGTPAEVGDFPLQVRVFDSGTPPQWATRELTLQVRIAPLQITGDTQYDLFVVKVVVLPMITVVESFPMPYSTQLQASGGLRPYAWAEQPIPDALRGLLPRAGLPDGLTLAADGTLSGAVTDTSAVISLTIPFVNITLNGFWFFGQVSDSQDPAQSKSALFLLPTLPLGGAGAAE